MVFPEVVFEDEVLVESDEPEEPVLSLELVFLVVVEASVEASVVVADFEPVAVVFAEVVVAVESELESFVVVASFDDVVAAAAELSVESAPSTGHTKQRAASVTSKAGFFARRTKRGLLVRGVNLIMQCVV